MNLLISELQTNSHWLNRQWNGSAVLSLWQNGFGLVLQEDCYNFDCTYILLLVATRSNLLKLLVHGQGWAKRHKTIAPLWLPNPFPRFFLLVEGWIFSFGNYVLNCRSVGIPTFFRVSLYLKLSCLCLKNRGLMYVCT